MLFGDNSCNLDTDLRDREVGGSNPLAPTIKLQSINRLESLVQRPYVSVWPICVQKRQQGTCSEL